jgi:two-component system, sensor histidine kinase and response regulator
MRLYHLTHNFLLYAELEMMSTSPDRPSLIRQNRQLRMPCQQPISETAHQCAQKYHRLTDLHLEIEAAELPISEAKLVKLMDELVDNAFKFSEVGQPVQIFARCVESGYQIDMIDHGRGLTLQQIAQMGGYMQFDRDRYEQQGGGLGLMIAKRLVEMHGGELVIHSIPERETLVRIMLPL